jgi:Protein of unknown function (DUF3237)
VQNTTRRTFTKLVAASAALALVPPLSAQEDDKLQSRFLANLVIEIDAGHDAGSANGGHEVVSVARGSIEGPRIKGTIISPSGDWMLQRPDKSRLLDVRLLVQTEDSESVYISCRGVAYTAANGKLFARITPVFETSAAKYAWLNNVVAVGVNRPMPGRVAYRIYEII